LAPTGQFSWNFIFENLQKSLMKLHVSLKSDKNNRYFTWKPMYIYDNTLLNSS
jgi:hypothetical protein